MAHRGCVILVNAFSLSAAVQAVRFFETRFMEHHQGQGSFAGHFFPGISIVAVGLCVFYRWLLLQYVLPDPLRDGCGGATHLEGQTEMEEEDVLRVPMSPSDRHIDEAAELRQSVLCRLERRMALVGAVACAFMILGELLWKWVLFRKGLSVAITEHYVHVLMLLLALVSLVVMQLYPIHVNPKSWNQTSVYGAETRYLFSPLFGYIGAMFYWHHQQTEAIYLLHVVVAVILMATGVIAVFDVRAAVNYSKLLHLARKHMSANPLATLSAGDTMATLSFLYAIFVINSGVWLLIIAFSVHAKTPLSDYLLSGHAAMHKRAYYYSFYVFLYSFIGMSVAAFLFKRYRERVRSYYQPV